nr:metallophosphatase family protein [Solirubrobacterales bacterium]
NLDRPLYYANGPEVPAALRAVQGLGASADTLDDELDDQLVGIARLVVAPGRRAGLAGLPSVAVASDLHNNLLALPALESAARGGPLLFAGDLTDRGSTLENRLARRVVRAGRPFVFVSGNHDSDVLERRLARDGAIVLTRRGRLRADGSTGRAVARVGGLRIAGYDDPLMRRSAEGFRDRGASPTPEQRQAFAAWLERLRGRVDAVMVHSPYLARLALEQLRADPPRTPLILVTGHTHVPGLQRSKNLTVINGGSVGGGGTGKLAEGGSDIGIATLTYRMEPGLLPLAADLVEIDPGSGSATAQRFRLDAPGDGGA